MLIATKGRSFGRGLGDWEDYVARLGIQDCTALPFSQQYACSLQNDAKMQAYQSTPAQVQYNANVAASEALMVAQVQGPAAAAQSVQQFSANNPQVTPAAVAAAITASQSAPAPAAPAPAPTPAKIAPGVLVIHGPRGDSQFQVGDNYILQIYSASPNQPVTASSSQNGQSHGSQSFGSTDANGSFTLSGTMGPDQVGSWSETWQVGGQTSGTINFTVSPAPAAPSAPAPSSQPAPQPATPVAPGVVSIQNSTRSGSTQFVVGDAWLIQIRGASPNQPVSATSSQNGQTHAGESFGNTDAYGNFSISGVMAADQIGTWAQQWFVGGKSSGVLQFVVLQAPGASGTQSTTPQSYTNTPTPNNVSGSNTTPDASSAPDTTAGYLTYSPDAYAGVDTTAGTSTTPTALTNFWSFLQQTMQIGSWAVPYWLVGAGGLGAVWAFRGHERSRR